MDIAIANLPGNAALTVVPVGARNVKDDRNERNVTRPLPRKSSSNRKKS